jgi:hypothetical protein
MTRTSLFGRRQPHRFNLGLRLTEFREYLQRQRSLLFIDPTHGKADVHQHPVTDAGLHRMLVIDDAGDVDLPLDAADIDGRKFP